MKKYLMGVDVGTTGTKAIVFDLDGNAVGRDYEEYSCVYPYPNWVEQDAELLAEATKRVCVQAVKNAGIDAGSIASVSVSAQRCCVLFMDDADNCLKMISWMDNRAPGEVKEIEERFGADRFYQITGLPLSTTWILSKLMWVRKNEPDIWNKTVRIVQLHDYILKKLGADEYYSDEPDSAFWGFWDTDKLCWNEELLSMFDIDRGMLPKVMRAGTRVGAMTGDFAGGIFAGVPICVGAGDQNCAAIGAGVVAEGCASVSIGTGGLATVFISSPFRDDLGKTIVTNSPVHGGWQIEGLQNGAAGVLRWFRDEIAALEYYLAEQNGTDVYEELNKLFDASPVGAKGLLFMPYFSGASTPRYNDDASGMMLGLSFSHTRADLARATIEGITMEQKDILSAIKATGIHLDRIRIMGGATNSEIWNQIQADIYGCRVETLKIKDAAVLGAAMCGAVGVGLFDSIEAAANALVRPDKAYEPIAENAAYYDTLYEAYCDSYTVLDQSGVYRALRAMQKGR